MGEIVELCNYFSLLVDNTTDLLQRECYSYGYVLLL